MMTRVAALEDLPDFPGPAHLAVGVFDGVHLGHREVLGLALREARRANGVAGVLTFDLGPSRIFRPENWVRPLLDPRLKDALPGRALLGLDFVVHHRFDREFAAMPAEAFLPWLRSRLPRLAAAHGWREFPLRRLSFR